MRRRLAILSTLALGALMVRCASFGATDGAAAGDVDAAGDASADGTPPDGSTGDAGADAACPSGRGPSMVRVKAPFGGTYCIDTTEVTNAEYAAFLADPTPKPTLDVCSAKGQDHLPHDQADAAAWPAAPGREPHPVVFVDWCDAQAFCAWANKRLCGAVGGGPAEYALAGNIAQREWGIACSAGGAFAYPYGQTFVANLCNDGFRPVRDTIAVGSDTPCHGGSDPAIFDQSGNVEEWENSCNGVTGLTDLCVRRGGSFNDGTSTAQYACVTGYDPGQMRGRRSQDVGIRCCAD